MRARTASKNACMIKATAALLFWLAVLLLQKFNWQLGVYKALVLLALLAAVPFVVAQARRGGDAAADHAPRLLKAAAVALLLAHVGYAVAKLHHPSLIDAANVTIAEGQDLRAGSNPYESALDTEAEAATHEARFAGYKYLPVTIAAYLPLGGALSPRGIVLTNLLLQVAVVALALRRGDGVAERRMARRAPLSEPADGAVSALRQGRTRSRGGVAALGSASARGAKPGARRAVHRLVAGGEAAARRAAGAVRPAGPPTKPPGLCGRHRRRPAPGVAFRHLVAARAFRQHRPVQSVPTGGFDELAHRRAGCPARSGGGH